MSAITVLLPFQACNVRRPSVDLASRSVAFNHMDSQGQKVSSCLPCHQDARPLGPQGVSRFDHNNIGSQDCAECHRNPGVSWSAYSVSHSPMPATCISCHESARPAPGVFVPVGAPKNLFVHAKEYGAFADCLSCHSDPNLAGKTFQGAQYNHKLESGLVVNSCANCHGQEKPAGLVGASNFDHATIGNQDCVSCHTNAGVTWQGAMSTFSHTPMPTSCNSCHAGQRPSPNTRVPTGATKNLFKHAAIYNGTADCVSCHTSVVANVGVTFAGGTFDHKTNTGANVTTCMECHDLERPIGTSPTSSYDHKQSGTLDCATCHNSPGVRWSGAVANYSHSPAPTSCATCHSGDRPSATTLLPVNATKNRFVHSATYNGTADCVSCHMKVPANLGVTFAGGFYDHKMAGGATVNNCLTCHGQEKPIGPKGNPPFDHASIGSLDCATCHTSPGGSWKVATRTFNHSPMPTSCASCHESSRPSPTTLVPANAIKNKFLHAATYNGLADCVSCHISVPANVGVTFAGGSYNHKTNTGTTVTSCNACHSGERPLGLVGGFNHAIIGTTDCASCHTKPGVSWSGALYNHLPVPTNCGSCHESKRPTIANPPPGNTFPTPAGTPNKHYLGKDCYSCHLSKSTTKLNWTFEHYNGSKGNINFCLPCHYTVGKRQHGNANYFTGDGTCYNCHRTRRSWNAN